MESELVFVMSLCEENVLLEHVKDYWQKRSDGYCRHNLDELNSFKKQAWTELILENAPVKDRLRILDIGTGPGFFAIIMALAGHDVWAVDISREMLSKAAANAQACGVTVNFLPSDVHELSFDDNSFNLVLSRNVTWNLLRPEHALGEWGRVLDGNGRLMYFDANWYLYLFDEELRKLHDYDFSRAREKGYENDCEPERAKIMEKLAESMPLSREYRPAWDRKTLSECGFHNIRICEDISDKVRDESEKVRYASVPFFMVTADKTGYM